MIITCAECSTRFDIEVSLLKKEGSKVRCCICETVFIVNFPAFPSALTTSDRHKPDATPVYKASLEKRDPRIGPELNIELDGLEDLLLKLDIPELEIEPLSLNLDTSLPEHDKKGRHPDDNALSFDLGIDDDKDTTSEIPSLDDDIQPNAEPIEEVTEFELEFDAELESNYNDSGDFMIEESEDDFIEQAPDLSQTHIPELILEESDPEIDLEQEPDHDPVFDPDTKQDIESDEDLPDVKEKQPPKKTNPTLRTPVLLFSLLVLICISAIAASLIIGYKIPVIQPAIDRFVTPKLPESAPIVIVPDENSVNGRFVLNETAGNLFVVTGKVINYSSVGVNHVWVKTTINAKEKSQTRTKVIYCGNTIPAQVLKTGKINDINTLQMKEEENTNQNIQPGGSIPFTVVFSDLPDLLQNFTVEVLKFDIIK
ncbi:MAG: zinc-ribbon domain-containing protein [Pseudomonadota bacterium]